MAAWWKYQVDTPPSLTEAYSFDTACHDFAAPLALSSSINLYKKMHQLILYNYTATALLDHFKCYLTGYTMLTHSMSPFYRVLYIKGCAFFKMLTTSSSSQLQCHASNISAHKCLKHLYTKCVDTFTMWRQPTIKVIVRCRWQTTFTAQVGLAICDVVVAGVDMCCVAPILMTAVRLADKNQIKLQIY